MVLVLTGASAWLLISLAFILDALKAPKHLIQMAVTILVLQMALLAVAYYTAECAGGPCVGEERITNGSGTTSDLLSAGIPLVTAVFTLYLVAYGLRRRKTG